MSTSSSSDQQWFFDEENSTTKYQEMDPVLEILDTPERSNHSPRGRPSVSDILRPKTVQDVLDIGEIRQNIMLEEKEDDVSSFSEPLLLTTKRRRKNTHHSTCARDLSLYWKMMLIIAIFYGLPATEFVLFQYTSNDSVIEEDHTCYFNFKCAHTFLGIYAFNNVISNLPYMLAGLGFCAIVRYYTPKSPIHGLPFDRSLYYSFGIAIALEGVFSSLYHICPNDTNFQFDLTFMIISSGVTFLSLYQKRHITFMPSATRAYSYFSIFILFNLISLLNFPPALFWTLVSILIMYISLSGSIYLYQHQSWSMLHMFRVCANRIKKREFMPRDKTRFVAILVANVFTLLITILSITLGVYADSIRSFSNFILALMILNFLIYLFYYVIMKIRHKETIHPIIYVLLITLVAFWAAAIHFFKIAITNKFLSWEESKALNQECMIFGYFDSHDLWHILSAGGLFTTMLLLLLIDKPLEEVAPADIAVF